MMRRWLLGLAACAALAPAAYAKGPPRELVPIVAGTPVTIKPDRGYILFQTFHPKGTASIEPVLLRVPQAEELAEYNGARAAAFVIAEPALKKEHEKAVAKQVAVTAAGKVYDRPVPPFPTLENFNFAWEARSNLENVDDSRPFIKGEGGSTYLVEVKPGDFVLFGGTFGMGLLKPGLHTCFCLGTVGFAVKAGEVTDMGTFMGDAIKFKSIIPEIAPESGYGPSSDTPFILIGATVRPAIAGSAAPTGLEIARIVAADYHAIGKFFHPGAVGINRLIPVPGVLAYDYGKVIDVKTGKVMPDRR